MLGDERDVAHAGIACHHALALRTRRIVQDTAANNVVRNAQNSGKALNDIMVVSHVGISQNGER